jgi:hypothetical protein
MTPTPVAAGPRVDWADLPDHVRDFVEAQLGSAVAQARTQIGGFSPGAAARLRLEDGRRAFVKAVGTALNPDSPGLHRREGLSLGLLPDSIPAPRLLGMLDDGDWVALVMEDVEGRTPSLPWRAADVTAVSDALVAVAEATTPAGLAPFADTVQMLGAWDQVAEDGTGVDEDLLARLDEMRELSAYARAATAGDAIVHWDVRADNVLIRADGSAVLLDWAWTCRGARWLDLFVLAFDFAVQGGPDPDALLSEHPLTRDVPVDHFRAMVGVLLGLFAERSRAPAPPGLPTIRAWQKHCLAATRRWFETSRLWT